jgi:hypothetical protein
MCMLELEKAGGRDGEGEGEDDALLRRRLLCLLFFSLSASYAIREQAGGEDEGILFQRAKRGNS